MHQASLQLNFDLCKLKASGHIVVLILPMVNLMKEQVKKLTSLRSSSSQPQWERQGKGDGFQEGSVYNNLQ